MSQHFMTIKHLSKLRKLNEVGNIFRYLFDLDKYSLITAIHFIIDDVEECQSFQTNGFEMIGVLCFLTLKIISHHSMGSLLQAIQRIIIKHNKDWHDGVTHQTSLGTFSFCLSYGKTLSLSSNFYLLSLLSTHFPQGHSFSTQSQIKYLLKMEIISTNEKEYLYTIFSLKSTNWSQNRDKIKKTKCNMYKSFGLILMGRLGKPLYQYFAPKVMIYQTAGRYFL